MRDRERRMIGHRDTKVIDRVRAPQGVTLIFSAPKRSYTLSGFREASAIAAASSMVCTRTTRRLQARASSKTRRDAQQSVSNAWSRMTFFFFRVSPYFLAKNEMPTARLGGRFTVDYNESHQINADILIDHDPKYHANTHQKCS